MHVTTKSSSPHSASIFFTEKSCTVGGEVRWYLRLRSVLLFALVAVAFIASGCDNSKGTVPPLQTEQVIRIGAMAPMTGEGADYGKWARRGVDLALETVNLQGQPPRFQVVWEDTQLNPNTAVSAFLKLVDVDHVPIVLGALTSGETIACLTNANTKRIVLLSPTATSDKLVAGGDYFFRVCPTNLIQAGSAAQFAVDQLKVKTAFVLFEDIAYGTDLATAFSKRFKVLGGSIAGKESFREGETDYRSLIQKVKQVNPDVVYAPSNYTEAATLLRQMSQLEVTIPVLGGDGSYGQKLVELAGSSAEGTYWTTIAWGVGGAKATAEAFQNRYRQAYGEAPHQFAGLYYDAARIAFGVVTRPGMTGTEVRRALLEMAPFDGATGTTKFTAKGQVDKFFAVYQVKNKTFVQIAP